MTIESLPELFVGPMVRHVSDTAVTLWCVTRSQQPIRLVLRDTTNQCQLFDGILNEEQDAQVVVGQHAVLRMIHVTPSQAIIPEHLIEYDLQNDVGESLLPISLRYQPDIPCHFVYQPMLTDVLHGSCRKPHGEGEDALLQVDTILESAIVDNDSRPSLLMMTGDQVYIDDVCGPMLDAIHQVIALLGLHDEQWQGGVVNDSQSLFKSDANFYLRESLLPNCDTNRALHEQLFKWKQKPIFTSVNSHNHLITLSEVMAMYFLVWSDALWPFVSLSEERVALIWREQYRQEHEHLTDFVDGLVKVRRALAHISSYLILDDHDVTDDFNLTREWEEVAYGHPFSRQIIGNALIGYGLCQAWGNQPQQLKSLVKKAQETITSEGLQSHEALIECVYQWPQWGYELNTQPPLVVLDTRTNRWRSESNPRKPSGLMDWESLTELQSRLLGHEAVMLVSPAPIYGVKFIEMVQRIFTSFGQALMVDAENWMAHPGTANVMLNMFKHPKTPPHFLILSGDVHYSFLYRIKPRNQQNLTLLQITASGIKNTFPQTLLDVFAWCNRVLFGKYSPFNWFTKRRKMMVSPIKPQDYPITLVNQCSIGRVRMDWQQALVDVSVESRKGVVRFPTQSLND